MKGRSILQNSTQNKIHNKLPERAGCSNVHVLTGPDPRKIKMKCKIRTKTNYIWDKPINHKIYKMMQTSCDLLGKGCKNAEDWKEKHTEKIESVLIRCDSD